MRRRKKNQLHKQKYKKRFYKINNLFGRFVIIDSLTIEKEPQVT